MLTAFKIFLFLLQHGLIVSGNLAMGESEPYAVAFPLPMLTILHIEGDENVLEETIVICQGIAPEATVTREPGSVFTAFRVNIVFDGITEDTKRTLTRQLIQRVAGRAMIKWKENGLQ